ncbi:MAG TPA: class I SAM-dependent methyltransferase, partial [Phototrophicaceae bacterium]|nr:class I SAM-dependent methyltransferase [Phototrophicaceae bacterium]
RLQQARIAIPENVELVPIDFETTSLTEGLRASSFDPNLPTFVSWLGVMVYLTQDAIDAVFQFVLSLPPTSEIVFTFTQPRTSTRSEQSQKQHYPGLAELAAHYGEDWKTLITTDDLVNYLQGLGFTAITLPTQTEIDTGYIQNRQDGLQASLRMAIASAIVPDFIIRKPIL